MIKNILFFSVLDIDITNSFIVCSSLFKLGDLVRVTNNNEMAIHRSAFSCYFFPRKSFIIDVWQNPYASEIGVRVG